MKYSLARTKKEGFNGQKDVVIPRKILAEKCANNKLIESLYITDIGYYPHASYHYIDRPQGADQQVLIYCHEGKGRYSLNGTTYEIEPGEYFVLPAKVPHMYTADERHPWSIYWVHFTGHISGEIVKSVKEKIGEKGFLANSQEAISSFKNIYASLELGYSNDNIAFANMYLWLFISTFLYNEKYALTKDDRLKSDIERSIDFMRKNVSRSLTVDEMAKFVNLSNSHFTFIFKKKTGFPPIDYFNHLKIQQACQYLLFTEMRIKEIASELGIDDPYYFTRLFTKIMGISPNGYREKRIP